MVETRGFEPPTQRNRSPLQSHGLWLELGHTSRSHLRWNPSSKTRNTKCCPQAHWSHFNAL